MIPAARLSLSQVVSSGQTMTRRSLSSAVDGKVAFIGLGNMGLPMSLNLQTKYPHILVYDNFQGARERAVAKGLHVAASTTELAESDCEILFTMLPNDKALHDTMTSLCQAKNNKPRMLIDCSTVSPATSRYWHEQWKEHNGSIFMDAPVSGGVKGAIDGTLTFMVGFEGSRVPDKANEYLSLMGQRIIACGGPGAGSVVKLCNNLALAAQMIGICEAMSLGEASGVDPVVLSDVMNTSTAKCWSTEICNPHPAVAMSKNAPASKDYEGGFGSKLMLKDLGLAVAAAEHAGVAVPLAAASKELYQMVANRGLGDKDFGVMFQFLKGQK